MNMNKQEFLAAVKKLNPGYSGGQPTAAKLWKSQDIKPSAELKAKIRRECPNNAAALIAAFGKTRTKYDAPLRTP